MDHSRNNKKNMDSKRTLKAALITLAIITAGTLIILFAKILLLALIVLFIASVIFFAIFTVVYDIIS